MTLLQSYKQFLTDNFKGLRLRSPLFFNWENGLRFDLQVENVGSESYFEEVFKRSTTLFQAAFGTNDNIILVLLDYKFKRRKIRPGNYCFKQIQDLRKEEVAFLKMDRLHEPYDSADIWNVAIVKTKLKSIEYKNILKAIGNIDFPARQPRLDKYSMLTSKEVFFVNIDRGLVFHMYDDRGLDIIANDAEELRSIYNQYNSWLLDCNREKMDNLFTITEG